MCQQNKKYRKTDRLKGTESLNNSGPKTETESIINNPTTIATKPNLYGLTGEY